jgi:hypothetical protein
MTLPSPDPAALPTAAKKLFLFAKKAVLMALASDDHRMHCR